MTRYDRRNTLRVFSAALAALSTQALAQEQRLTSIGSPGRIAPPSCAMIYTRRLVRNLSDNAQIIVKRGFTIHFTRSPGGYLVDGSQVSVDVQTPEQLAPLADLERARVESGIFPLELDASGRIRFGAGVDEVPEIDLAMDYVARKVAAAAGENAEGDALGNFIAAVHEAGNSIVSTLPIDLFAPQRDDRTDRRQIEFPLGGTGVVTTEFVATRDPVTGLLANARRDVTTSIGGEERRTSEYFTLAPATTA